MAMQRLTWCCRNASATGEILAKFFLDNEMSIDSVTAEALYLGICTDTGQFCYSGTNASVFEVCQRLCEAGANPSSVAHELYEREKPGRIQLLQKFLASFRMEFGRSRMHQFDPGLPLYGNRDEFRGH